MNSITINGITLELQKECHDCCGVSAYEPMTCDTCGNTGIVERYWTPGEVEESGLKMLDTDPVWRRFKTPTGVKLEWHASEYGLLYVDCKWQENILKFPFQPAPPKDYKP